MLLKAFVVDLTASIRAIRSGKLMQRSSCAGRACRKCLEMVYNAQNEHADMVNSLYASMQVTYSPAAPRTVCSQGVHQVL